MKIFKHNIIQFLISFDQCLHCLIGTLCNYTIYADESFSSFQYRRFLKGKTAIKKGIDLIFYCIFRQEEHCKSSYISERKSRHLPPEMRQEKEEV